MTAAAPIRFCRVTTWNRQTSADPTERTHSIPSATTHGSAASVPMPKVWAKATGQDR